MFKRSAPHGNIQLRRSGAGNYREQCATTSLVKCLWSIAGCLFIVSVSMFMDIMQPSNTIEIISGVDQNKQQQQSKSLPDRREHKSGTNQILSTDCYLTTTEKSNNNDDCKKLGMPKHMEDNLLSPKAFTMDDGVIHNCLIVKMKRDPRIKFAMPNQHWVTERIDQNTGLMDLWDNGNVFKRAQESKPEDGIFIDVGGWVGDTSIISAAMGIDTYVFEPVRNNTNMIHFAISANDCHVSEHLTVVNAMVGEENRANQSIYVTSRSDNAAATKDQATKNVGIHDQDFEQPVEMVALDSFFPSGTKVQNLKIDVQGFELQVLHGAKRILEENKGRLHLRFEYDKGLIEAAGNNPDEIIAFVEKVMGYSRVREDESDLDYRFMGLLSSNEHDDDPSVDMKLSDEEVFCPECRWNGRSLCSDRVQFLITKYNTDIESATTSAMEDSSCKKKKKDQMPMVDIIRYATDFNRDMGKTQLYYKQNQRSYRNKADFAANQRLLGHINTLNLGRRETTIFVGGTNEGQLSKSILDSVPDVTFYGFEIQKDAYEKAKENLSGFSNAQILNMGWSEFSVENVTIRGRGEAAGLYNPNGGEQQEEETVILTDFTLQNETVNTIPLAEFTKLQNISSVLYTVIDTEGYEPKVIRGMRLEDIVNQQRFPLFQFELGGTWAERDLRHGNDAWNQMRTVQSLEGWGYMTFLAGVGDWLAVNSNFFDESKDNPAMKDEGNGRFVQGNVLVMHGNFTPPDLKSLILDQVRIEY